MYSAPVAVTDDYLEIYSQEQLDFMSQMVKKVPPNMHYIVYAYYFEGGAYSLVDPDSPVVEYILAYGPEVEIVYSNHYGDRTITSVRVFSSTGYINMYQVAFRNYDSYWASSGWKLPLMGDIKDNARVSSFTVYRDYPQELIYNATPWSCKWLFNDSTEFSLVPNTWKVHLLWGVWSDVGYFPDLRDSEEVYDHAQTVILASFVLFAVFRSLWRSIRGRDT